MKTLVSILLALCLLVQPTFAAASSINLLQLPVETSSRDNRQNYFNFTVPASTGSFSNGSITLTISVTATTSDTNHYGPTLPSEPFLRFSVTGFLIRGGSKLAEKSAVMIAKKPVVQLPVGKVNVFTHVFSQTITIPVTPTQLSSPARFLILGSIDGSGTQTAITLSSATARLNRN